MDEILQATIDEPGVAAFLDAHLADMHTLSPADSVHALSTSRFRDPSVRLWVVRDAGEVVGSVALQTLGACDVELKSMRVAPSRRGTGLGRALLEHALDVAAEDGAARVYLETGTREAFAPARSLYASRGFAECEPFGTYLLDPESVFMTLELPVRVG